MERNQKTYDKLIRAVRPVLVRRFGAARTEQILQDAGPVYSRFLEETPSIGGKANMMNQSMDMALPFLRSMKLPDAPFVKRTWIKCWIFSWFAGFGRPAV